MTAAEGKALAESLQRIEAGQLQIAGALAGLLQKQREFERDYAPICAALRERYWRDGKLKLPFYA